MTDLTDKQKATIEKYAAEVVNSSEYGMMMEGGEVACVSVAKPDAIDILTRFRSAVRAEYREECGEPVAWVVDDESETNPKLFFNEVSAEVEVNKRLHNHIWTAISIPLVALPKEEK